jgi:hypothetical protein
MVYDKRKPLKDYYLDKWMNSREDFTGNLPMKRTDFVYQHEIGNGVLGYTILGNDYAVVSKDARNKEEVDAHEAIHTPDEYETLVLGRLITSKEVNNYERSWRRKKTA